MSGYKLPFHIANEILAYVSSISEKIGKISATTNLETKPHLRRNNSIKSIHSSLKIEANSLSFRQVTDVINGNLVPAMNDRLGIHSVLLPTKLSFGDSLWSLERFYHAVVTSSLITLAIFVENVVLEIIDITKK